MDSSAINNPETLPSENVEKYFRWITERCQLPSIPLLAGQILKMTQDPDLNVRELCRLLSDDTALTRRILAVARAPYYAQRTTPTTLVEAVNVLGFRTVSSVVVASAASSLCIKGNRISEKLWAHSLGVALGTRVLFKRAGLR